MGSSAGTRAAPGRWRSRACWRSRPAPAFTRVPSWARGRSTSSTAGWPCTSGCPQAAADGKGIAPSNLYDVNVAPLGPEHQGAVRRADAGERGPSRGARAGWHAGARATAAVLVRRRHRPPRRDDQALLDRRASREPARLPVRRHGAVPVVRRGPASRLERRRPALGELRRAGAPARQGDRYVPAPEGGPAAAPASAAAVLSARPRRPGTAVSAAAVRRPVRDTHRAGPHRVRRGVRRHDPPLLGGLDRNTMGDRTPAPRALHGRCAVSLVGPGTQRSRRSCAAGAASTLAAPGRRRRSVSLRDVVYFYIAGEDTGYVVVPTGQRPRATAHILRPKAQSSAPRPGPTLAVQLAQGKRFRRSGLGSAHRSGARTSGDAARVARWLRRRTQPAHALKPNASDGGVLPGAAACWNRRRSMACCSRSALHERVDDIRIELPAGTLAQLADGDPGTQRVAVGPVRGHGVVCVAREDDAARQRDVFAGAAGPDSPPRPSARGRVARFARPASARDPAAACPRPRRGAGA